MILWRVQDLHEVETKLTVPDDFVLPALDGVKGVHAVSTRSATLRARYFDTEALALAQHGVTLRHRTGDGEAGWTLKLGGVVGGALDRRELSVPASRAVLPRQLSSLLVALHRGEPLRPVVELLTRRTSLVLLNESGDELAELVDDVVEVVGGTGWHELELEQRDAGTKVHRRVLDALLASGAQLGDQTPKALRVLDVPFDAPVQVGPDDPVGELVRWSLRTRGSQLLEHDLGVRRGLPDAVHQLRVTCRRLRSDLRALRPMLDDPRAEALRGELRWLADSLGTARDLEVLRARLRRTAEHPTGVLDVDPVDALLEAEERTAAAEGDAALGSPRYLAVLGLLEELAGSLRLAPAAAGPCRRALPPLLKGTWRALRRRADRLGLDSPDEEWHGTRIAAKRARYTAETARVALGGEVRRQVKAAEKVQEHLGEHQDAVVAVQRLEQLASENPALGVLCGRLVERERAQALQARRAFLAQLPLG